MATKEFIILLNCLGWGDPDATLWTVGIEEGEEWCRDRDTLDINEIRNKISKFDKKGKDEWVVEVHSEKGINFPIANTAAKIACGISRSYHNWKAEWRKYRENKLWRIGSKTCNINVYPLGKKSLSKGFPECYKDIFGEDVLENYDEIVKRERIKKIRDFYKRKQPEAIICYGKSYWKGFEELFELEGCKSINKI